MLATWAPLSQARQPSPGSQAGGKIMMWGWMWGSPSRFSPWGYSKVRIFPLSHPRFPRPLRARIATFSASARTALAPAMMMSMAATGSPFVASLSSQGTVIRTSFIGRKRLLPRVNLFPARSHPLVNWRSSSAGGCSSTSGSHPTAFQSSGLKAIGFTFPSRER